jgi:hypothetical protein
VAVMESCQRNSVRFFAALGTKILYWNVGSHKICQSSLLCYMCLQHSLNVERVVKVLQWSLFCKRRMRLRKKDGSTKMLLLF